MVSAMVNIEQSDYVSALAGFKQIATLKATFDGLSNADKLTLQSMTVTITYGDGMSKTTNLVDAIAIADGMYNSCLLYTSPSPRDRQKSRMPSSA